MRVYALEVDGNVVGIYSSNYNAAKAVANAGYDDLGIPYWIESYIIDNTI